MSKMFSAELAFRSLKVDEAAFRAAKHILHLDASHGPSSVIAQGASALFTEIKKSRPEWQIEHVRLWEEGTRKQIEYNMSHVQSKMAMLSGTSRDEDIQNFTSIEALAERAATAQCLVISAPVWNYGVPYVLKQYFDCVLHPGLTFRETESGPKGLFGNGRPLVILSSSGGSGSKDHLTPWLRDVGAMMGFDATEVVTAPYVANSNREEVIERFVESAAAAAKRVGVASARAPVPENSAEAAVDKKEEIDIECSSEVILRWLRTEGGLSEDCFESLEAIKINGEMFVAAREEDWQDEELGLEEADLKRLKELQTIFRRLVGCEGLFESS
eukprot:TRINITY_DN84646_c0_g1_i1.p1 TRINITY_DN84646_c0_g1~~TRINITY_DN84646_c0_g1_i1.p1  ORF type:complete len:336 (-),score=70.43 TRINITY_DN84646_c0_g1_i1:109-1095(-)